MTAPKSPKAAKPRASRPSRPNRPSPSEIAPGVYVGGWHDAGAFEGARFCVLDEAPAEMPKATHVPIYDEGTDRADVGKLDRLAEGMAKARARGEPVLVFCGHGVRRSPLGAVWYFHRAHGLSLDAAYDRVRAVRPQIEHARDWVGNADELEAA
ncbi:MAG TPA: dual specificity protein phosphatase family protein [Thermoplasmata archaeon]|nr:dual specificity protein phosphatase family protein [Thermoplasmata archaeon]